MDMSLDDYIVKKPGGNRNSVKNRLGQKPTQGSQGRTNFKVAMTSQSAPSRQNPRLQHQTNPRQRSQVTSPNTNFNVVGLNKVSFDARQKLSPKRLQTVQDARQRLANKRQFGVDARVRIQNRTGQKQPIPRVQPPGSNLSASTTNVNDMRVKIQSAKSQNLDARQMIQARQHGKGTSKMFTGQTKVTIAGVTGPGSTDSSMDSSEYDVSQMHGSLQKTFSLHPEATQENNVKMPLRKTIHNSSAVISKPNRIGNNIVLTPSNSYTNPHSAAHVHVEHPPLHQQHIHLQQQQQQQQQAQPLPPHQYAPAYSQQFLHDPYRQPQPQYAPMSQPPPQPQEPQYAPTPPQYTYQEPMPTIRIKNEAYQLPSTLVQPPAPPPVDQSRYYREPEVEPSRSLLSTIKSDPALSMSTNMTNRMPATLEGRLGAELEEESEFSPLQGYRLAITNLHPIVTQEDILELFGAVGALKRARLIKAGIAEVVFVRREEAMAAMKKYHNRELDGQPMQVVLAAGGNPRPSTQEAANNQIQLPSSSRANPAGGDIAADVDVSLLHKALFKTVAKDDAPQRPVTFTVKI